MYLLQYVYLRFILLFLATVAMKIENVTFFSFHINHFKRNKVIHYNDAIFRFKLSLKKWSQTEKSYSKNLFQWCDFHLILKDPESNNSVKMHQISLNSHDSQFVYFMFSTQIWSCFQSASLRSSFCNQMSVIKIFREFTSAWYDEVLQEMICDEIFFTESFSPECLSIHN